MTRKPPIFVVLTALLLAWFAGPAAAQAAEVENDSVLVRVNGDATVSAGESHGTIVVINGDLEVQGTATTVVVVSGRADLVGATVETLVVVEGTAELGAGTTVTGDVRLVDAQLIRDPSATVEGTVRSGTGDFSRGFWIAGLLFMVGWAVMTILAALLLAAVAPDLARRSGRVITDDLGRTIIAALIMWIAVPILGAILFASIIGIAAALTIWLAVLPAMAFVGFLVAGVRLGEYVTNSTEGVGHPYLAALVGVVILLAAGAIPWLGPLVVGAATFLGSGALALRAFRAIRRQPSVPVPPVPAPPAAVTDG